ncbi:MAG: hypothetical protein ACRECM_09015, partial [Methyloceanibacter sp.]
MTQFISPLPPAQAKLNARANEELARWRKTLTRKARAKLKVLSPTFAKAVGRESRTSHDHLESMPDMPEGGTCPMIRTSRPDAEHSLAYMRRQIRKIEADLVDQGI